MSELVVWYQDNMLVVGGKVKRLVGSSPISILAGWRWGKGKKEVRSESRQRDFDGSAALRVRRVRVGRRPLKTTPRGTAREVDFRTLSVV